MSECSNCGRIFANVMQMGPHRRMCLARNNANICENCDDSQENLITAPVDPDDDGHGEEDNVCGGRISLQNLARRLSRKFDWGVSTPCTFNPAQNICHGMYMRDYTPVPC